MTQPTEKEFIELWNSFNIVRNFLNKYPATLEPPVVVKPPVVIEPNIVGFGAGVTGGLGGAKKDTDSHANLKLYGQSDEPMHIHVTKNITGAGFTLKSNKTITFAPGVSLIGVGLWFNGAENIIIRNLSNKDTPIDQQVDVLAFRESQRVWLDHCDLRGTPGVDGLFDMTQGSDLFTVSNCILADATKCSLVGGSDTTTSDIGKLRVTFIGNHFLNNLERSPSIRFGFAHMINNLFEHNADFKAGPYKGYQVASRVGAKVRFDSNVFLNIQGQCLQTINSATIGYGQYSGLSTSKFINSPNNNLHGVIESDFTTPYEFPFSGVDEVEKNVRSKAGATLIL